MLAAIEREAALQGIPFADENVAPVEPVLTRSDIEIEKRIDALLAKAENKDAKREDLMARVFSEDPALYEKYRQENSVRV